MSSIQRAPGTGANGAPAQGDQIQQAATGLINQAARTADAQASTTMTRVGDSLVSVAQAIDEAAGRLRETQPEVAGFVETAASRVEETATYLREHDASEVLDGLQHAARRQPALVIGGGLALGLLLGRFLRSGAAATQDADRAMTRYGGSTAYGGTGYRGTGAGYGSTAYGSTGAATGAGATDLGSTGMGSTGMGSTGMGSTDYGTRAESLGGVDVSDELVATDEAAVMTEEEAVIEVGGERTTGAGDRTTRSSGSSRSGGTR